MLLKESRCEMTLGIILYLDDTEKKFYQLSLALYVCVVVVETGDESVLFIRANPFLWTFRYMGFGSIGFSSRPGF